MTNAIVERYAKETETDSLGCANLRPFMHLADSHAVLDLGCGSGAQALSIKRDIVTGGYVAGVDMTHAMIEKARSRDGAAAVDFQVADIHALPFDEGRFDLVYSNCVINHSPDKRGVYREIYRVLKSGGRFVAGDVMSVERLPESVSNDPDAVAACWGGAVPREEYLSFIAEAGFTGVRVHSSRRYMKNGYELESCIIEGLRP